MKFKTNGPATSAAAAKSISRQSAEKMYAKIVKPVRRAKTKGATIDELSAKTGIGRQTLSPRLTEMEERGLIYKIESGYFTATGKPQFLSRSGNSGRAQQLWFATL